MYSAPTPQIYIHPPNLYLRARRILTGNPLIKRFYSTLSGKQPAVGEVVSRAEYPLEVSAPVGYFPELPWYQSVSPTELPCWLVVRISIHHTYKYRGKRHG